MDIFYKYFSMGAWRAADFSDLVQPVFFIVLLIVYTLAAWRRGLVLALAFTLASALGLALSASGVFSVSHKAAAFALVAITTLTAIFGIFGAGNKPSTLLEKTGYAMTIAFGAFYGLSSGSGFGGADGTLFPIVFFSIGLAVGAALLALVVLAISSLLQFFGCNRRDTVMVISSVAVGIMIPYLVRTFPFTIK